MEVSGSCETNCEKNYSKLLLAGDPLLCEILQEKLLQQYTRSNDQEEVDSDGANYLIIRNKYFLSKVIIDIKKISGEDDQQEESGYTMLDDDSEEQADLDQTPGKDASNPAEPECTENHKRTENQIQKEAELSRYDCVVVVHDPNSSQKEYDQICKFISTLHGIDFEVKILFLNLKTPKIDEFNIEELFERTESFIEVIADTIDEIQVQEEQEDKMDENGE